jgi:hypothetical protein
VIRHIERLEAELNVMTLGDLEGLGRGEVPLACAGRTQGIHANITHAVIQSRIRTVECRDVPEALWSWMGQERADASGITGVGVLIQTVTVPASGLGNGETIHESDDAAELPSTERCVHYTTMVQKLCPLPTGNW